jgi:MoxR-like ATPase
VEEVAKLYGGMVEQVGKVIVGQGEVVEELLVALLAGGHVLIEGVPGTAKTLLARTIAYCLDAEFNRVQFTPDLMPSDIIGTNVYEMGSGVFHLNRGPVFCDVLLADEVNRTPPKTQAALLEAMEERQVTIDGTAHELSDVFFVIATQNPVEFEGTYPLPEAQIDRFLMKVEIHYPSEEDELGVLRRHHEGLNPWDLAASRIERVANVEALASAQAGVRAVTVDESLFRYMVRIVRETRAHPSVTLGASPRAAVGLLAASKALAAVGGREFVTPDDVKRAARPVLRHRLVIRAEADVEGITSNRVIEDVLGALEVPR